MLGGNGIPLPPPQVLYPPQLPNTAYQAATNRYTLSAGNTELIPPGLWDVTPGLYGMIQWLDPVSGIWYPFSTVPNRATINSDGSNFRVANLTGCPIGALITTAGSGYSVTTPPTVTAGAGGSLWKAIVGGSISTTTTITTTGGVNGGSNYTYTPTVYISAPPPGGVPATATATISGGAVTAITVVNVGAGYPSAPTGVCITDPNDPNAGTIIPATFTTALATGATATAVTALLCTNYGTPQTATPTLTIAAPASGTTAVATAVMCYTVTSASVTTATTAYGSGTAYAVLSVGGITAGTAALTQPAIQTGLLTPRPVQIFGTATSAGALSGTNQTIIDGGLFETTPTAVVVANQGTGGAITFLVGGATTQVTEQLLGSNF